MSKSLKDALLKAGLQSSKTQNDRVQKKGTNLKQSEKHQYTRTFCEVCELDHGDVERYKHRNPTIDAEWICLGCADKNMIDDRFRVTMQSELSKKGNFRRYFGATKDPKEFDRNFKPKNPRNNRNADGNKKQQHNKKPQNKNRNFNR